MRTDAAVHREGSHQAEPDVLPARSDGPAAAPARRCGRHLFLFLLAGLGACIHPRPAADGENAAVTVRQIEDLRSMEALLPVAPDSVVARYRQYDRENFHRAYGGVLEQVARLVDSLNGFLPPGDRIDTIAIDHTIEQMGMAARTNRTLSISSGYFFLYPGFDVLRSIVFHEFGHVQYERLDTEGREQIAAVYRHLRSAALFYLFQDGEYSGNARFGGHPAESPEELFASAFNLMQNRSEEFRMRLRFVESHHLPFIAELEGLVGRAARGGR